MAQCPSKGLDHLDIGEDSADGGIEFMGGVLDKAVEALEGVTHRSDKQPPQKVPKQQKKDPRPKHKEQDMVLKPLYGSLVKGLCHHQVGSTQVVGFYPLFIVEYPLSHYPQCHRLPLRPKDIVLITIEDRRVYRGGGGVGEEWGIGLVEETECGVELLCLIGESLPLCLDEMVACGGVEDPRRK